MANLITLKEIEISGIRQLEFKNGRFTRIEGRPAVIQRLENRIRRFLDEFFDGPGEGIDWLDIFNSRIDEDRIETVIRAELLKDEFVQSVLTVDVSIDRKVRTAKVEFNAVGIDDIPVGGEVIISGG